MMSRHQVWTADGLFHVTSMYSMDLSEVAPTRAS